MNKAQFKRLMWVMLIPLLLLGWWIAEAEWLIEHHFMTDCEEFQEHFSCYSTQVSKAELIARQLSAGGVYLWTGARLSYGLNADIVSSAIPEEEYKDGGGLHEKRIVGAGGAKRLNVAMNVGASEFRSCGLSPVVDTGEWHLSCPGNYGYEFFRFANKAVGEKFRNLEHIAAAEKSRTEKWSRVLYVYALFIPVGVFILLSIVALIVVKVFSFVRYGAQRGREG